MGLFSSIKLRSILSAKPVSDKFGFDRGTPIDRYYIEKFLYDFRSDIRGEVLEIAEATYTRKFGGQHVKANVLHFDHSNPEATIVGDLKDAATLPNERIDCFICTQTFNFIYDFMPAIAGSRFVLKRGGVLLATLACMSPISKYDADRWGDFWRFTPQSAKKAFGEIFGEKNVEIFPLGNSAAASLFMKGYALEDLKGKVDLDLRDELFPLIIGVRARRWD